MPAKHWLVETEDGGDDSEGVTETRSKILGFKFQYIDTIYLLSCRLDGKQEMGMGPR